MRRLIPALGACLAAAVLVPAAAVASPSVGEFSTGLSGTAQIHGVVAGPDGNVWMTDNANGTIDRVTTAGTITQFSGIASNSSPEGITVGPDGALWFVGSGSSSIGRMTTAGTLTNTYTMTGTSPQSIVTGPDGALWFTESGNPAKIGRITTAGAVSEYALPTASSSPWGITVGPDGDLWFTEHTNPGAVGKIDPVSHQITEYTLPSGLPYQIVAGPDGKLWMTLGANPGKLARIATDGSGYQEWAVPTANSNPLGLTRAPDGYLYFTEKTGSSGAVGRVSSAGSIQEFPGGSTTGFTSSVNPWGLAVGPDGNIWFAESAAGHGIARLSIEPVTATGSATAVSHAAATLNGSVTANSQATTAYFQYGTTTAYGAQSATSSAGSGASSAPLAESIGLLAGDTTYHYRLVATNASGTRYGADATFTTQGAGGDVFGGSTGTGDGDGGVLPTGSHATPTLGKTVVVRSAGGAVLIRTPHGHRFSTLGPDEAIPVGSTIDASRGSVTLTSVRDAHGTLQSGTFSGGAFEVRQTRSGVTDLYLRGGDFRGCRRHIRHGEIVAAAARRRAVRSLWGRDNHGRFRTHGSHAVVTVRGTEWLTSDRCDGTLTRVARGKVAVTDLTLKRTVLVKAGMSYLARASR